MLAMANARVAAHWLQCNNCNGWFDPFDSPAIPGEVLSLSFAGKVVCLNCALVAGVSVCVGCGISADNADLCKYNGFDYCEECAHSQGLELCSSCEKWYNSDDIVNCNSGGCGIGSSSTTEPMCEVCAEEAGWARCECCDEWISSDNQQSSPDGYTYCEDCFCESYSYCCNCDNCFCIEDMHAHNGDAYCSDCCPDGENFRPAGFRNHSGCTTKTGSERCYGLELETNDCNGYDDLQSDGAWGAKNDPTCNGKEFYSDILDGDDGLRAVADFAALAEEKGWVIGNNCGYHLHIDMRQENDDSLFAAAYAYRRTQELWHCFVESRRCDNTYSHRARWTPVDLEGYAGTFRQFVRDSTRGRYEWLNLHAYDEHATFEVRLHHASLDENEICNWVKAHTRFVDWVTTLGLAGVKEALDNKTPREQLDIISREAWQDEELCQYYTRKAEAENFTAC